VLAGPPVEGLPTISVVVGTFDMARMGLLERCVGSLGAQRRPPREVLVVVDHNPALYERCRSSFPDATVLESTASPGCAGTRNAGARAAQGEIIVFLDDDAWAEPEWLLQLTRPFEDPMILGTTGRVVPIWPDDRPAWFAPEFDWVIGCSYVGLPIETGSVRNLWGTMAFRREAFVRAGGFDEALGRRGSKPLGGEDTEFSIRARSMFPHADLIYVGQAIAHHSVERERVRFSYFIRRCFAEGLSKAQVARSVGRLDGLATERAYTRRVLPAGIRGCLGRAAHGDPGAFARAVAMVAGLASACVGYAAGSVKSTRRPGHRPGDRMSQAPETVIGTPAPIGR
jgi:GT2 family glycosyltransferase